MGPGAQDIGLTAEDLRLRFGGLGLGAWGFRVSACVPRPPRIEKSTLQKLSSQKRRVATGTTTLRTLESIYWMAVYHKEIGVFPEILPQWLPYEMEDGGLSYNDALTYLQGVVEDDEVWTFQTQIMIKPGYRIRSIAGLITNFHQPNSTLLCLVSACLESGNHNQSWQNLYDVALREQYRFLSYGDGCLIELT